MTFTRTFELLACLLFAGLAVIVLWEIRDIPPPLFGPVGSGDLPRVMAIVVLALAGATALRSLLSKRRAAAEDRPPAVARTIVVLLLTLIYASVIEWGAVDFGLISTAYLWAAIGYLTRPRGVAILMLALIGAAIGLGADALFTRVLYIDLP